MVVRFFKEETMNEEKLKEMQIEQKAKELKAAYQREWAKKNPEKVKKSQKDFWKRKAIAALEAEQQNQK